ncbi:hypothetical protein [Bacillus cereus]|uniref:hypothetical protein n=1 Tax=Bacillus cereus TaxID=1396 RepID=UPI00192D2754|nr:hypothetical protein [Bacillus cereus]MDA2329449.1 hypothetical protein [Bacillus cereus]MDA2335165.1 hypothetical protein [Bacillus cereus]
MKNSTRNDDGLNFGLVIYNEVEQNLQDTLGNDNEARQAFYVSIINGRGSDIQMVGGVDFSVWNKDLTIAANPILLAKRKDQK